VSTAEIFDELRQLGTPILVIAKYPVEHDGFVPLVEVYAGPVSLGPFESYEDMCENAPSALAHFLADYIVEQPLTYVNLCGFKAAEFVATYSFEADGQFWPTRMQSLLVHTNSVE
jgi:hypothetical protein